MNNRHDTINKFRKTPMTMLTFRCPNPLFGQLKRLSDNTGLFVSELIRQGCIRIVTEAKGEISKELKAYITKQKNVRTISLIKAVKTIHYQKLKAEENKKLALEMNPMYSDPMRLLIVENENKIINECEDFFKSLENGYDSKKLAKHEEEIGIKPKSVKGLIGKLASNPNKRTATLVNTLRNLPPVDSTKESAFVSWISQQLAI